MDQFNKKLGYYKCGEKEFESKIQAFFYSLESKSQVEWIFNDAVFKSYDWKVEPTFTLDELYNQRARDLREKYDYLILCYSGGADSHNILMAFLRQGLVIDELLINTLEKGWTKFIDVSGTNKDSKNTGAEHYLQTLPRLKELENQLPRTKITICDLTDFVFDYYSSEKQDLWFLNKKESLNPLGASRFNFLHVPEVRKRIDKQKSIGVIIGIDKPKCIIHHEKFYTRFTDRTANIISITDYFTDYDNTTAEFFYWSPDAVPLLIKQAHVLKKWVEANTHLHRHWDSRTINHKIMRTLHEQEVRSVIYSTWNDNWFQVDKAVKDWYSEFDHWFIEGNKDTRANHNWQQSINYVEQSLGQFAKVDEETQRSDGLQVFQKNYLIGDFKRAVRD